MEMQPARRRVSTRRAGSIVCREPHERALSGFNFTFHMRRLCEELITRVPELAHIDLGRVAIGYCQARKAVSHGLQASLTPLRFEGGNLFAVRRRREWTIQRLFDPAGREMLYILNFYLPRFLHGQMRDKLTTVVHELWHIGPAFDGDLRRHPGRCYAHSPSQKKYDEGVERLVDRWLEGKPPEESFGFLRCSFAQLLIEHGAVYGLRIPAPKLLPV